MWPPVRPFVTVAAAEGHVANLFDDSVKDRAMTSGNADSEFGVRRDSNRIVPRFFIAAEQVFLARWPLTAATVTKGLRRMVQQPASPQ